MMTIARSIILFALAALFEIGGAWLVWQGWSLRALEPVDGRALPL